MNRKSLAGTLIRLLLLLCIVAAPRIAGADERVAANWPQWRGPSGDGTSTLTGLPTAWDAHSNVRWSTPLPAWSGSSPIVWGDTVFVTSPGPQGNPKLGRRDPGGERIFLFALDRTDGSIRWKHELGAGNELRMKQNMSSPSPVTDGAHVWSMTGQGDLVALDFKGEEVWRRNLQKDYGRFGLNWGFASSPLLYEDRLIIPVLHGSNTDDASYVLAVDKSNGKTLWKTERPTQAVKESPDAYTTPLLFEREGRLEIIVTGGDLVTAYDPANGEEIWRLDALNPRRQPNYRVVGSPVAGGGTIFTPTRVQPLLAIRPEAEGPVTPKNILWQTRGADVPTPVTDGRYLWIVDDRGALSCLDVKTGKDMYPPQRLERGTYSASPVLADGKIYATSEEGATTVVEAAPEFRILAVNRLNDSYTLSSPAIAQGEIFIRTSNRLYCIAER